MPISSLGTETLMNFIKKLESELILDWQLLQLETDLALKALALEAYYIKYKLLKKRQAWQIELQS